MSCPCSKDREPGPAFCVHRSRDGTWEGSCPPGVRGNERAVLLTHQELEHPSCCWLQPWGWSLLGFILLSRSCSKGKRQRTWQRSAMTGGGSRSKPPHPSPQVVLHPEADPVCTFWGCLWQPEAGESPSWSLHPQRAPRSTSMPSTTRLQIPGRDTNCCKVRPKAEKQPWRREMLEGLLMLPMGPGAQSVTKVRAG